jgi:hypothetical protein
VALSVVTLLAGAGCSSGGSLELGGGIEPSGGVSEDRARDGDGQEPQEPEESPEPVEQTGFDECELMEPAELAGILGIDQLYITEREVYQPEEGGRLTRCGYFVRDIPGVSGIKITMASATTRETFFRPFEQFDNVGELADLGDHAEVIALTGNGGQLKRRELRVIDGDTGFVRQFRRRLVDDTNLHPERPSADLHRFSRYVLDYLWPAEHIHDVDWLRHI